MRDFCCPFFVFYSDIFLKYEKLGKEERAGAGGLGSVSCWCQVTSLHCLVLLRPGWVQGVFCLWVFLGLGSFLNHWISGIGFPRHINVILEKLLLTPCQIFLMKWKVFKSPLLPWAPQRSEPWTQVCVRSLLVKFEMGQSWHQSSKTAQAHLVLWPYPVLKCNIFLNMRVVFPIFFFFPSKSGFRDISDCVSWSF